MVVPRIFYQTWKDKNVPKTMADYRDRWLYLLGLTPSDSPTSSLPPLRADERWKTPLLTDEDLRNLVITDFPQYLKFYDSMTKPIERVDFARYIMMYRGGVYADLDTYPVRSIQPWLDLNKIVLGEEPPEHASKLYKRKMVICNAFMISPPGLEFWPKFMDYIVSKYTPNSDPVYTTGPLVFSQFYDDHPELFSDVVVASACNFFPLVSDGTVTQGCSIQQQSYVVHMWHNTWVSEWKSVAMDALRSTYTKYVIVYVLLLLLFAYLFSIVS